MHALCNVMIVSMPFPSPMPLLRNVYVIISQSETTMSVSCQAGSHFEITLNENINVFPLTKDCSAHTNAFFLSYQVENDTDVFESPIAWNALPQWLDVEESVSNIFSEGTVKKLTESKLSLPQRLHFILAANDQANPSLESQLWDIMAPLLNVISLLTSLFVFFRSFCRARCTATPLEDANPSPRREARHEHPNAGDGGEPPHAVSGENQSPHVAPVGTSSALRVLCLK